MKNNTAMSAPSKKIQLQSLALKFNYDVEQNTTEFFLLDQTLLPHEEKWLSITTTEQMIEAIKSLRVRGAPLIGVAAALSLAQSAINKSTTSELRKKLDLLFEARPTAVNLMNCLNEMRLHLKEDCDKNCDESSKENSVENFVAKAISLFHEDFDLCERIATHGANLISDGDQILTHCNTGGLATAGIGTALGIIRKAHEQGKKIHVYVDETRPLLQGGRLTAWELEKLNIPYTLITDNMAAQLMSLGKIQKAFVGSDRIACNGDFANKIGTYGVAVSCKYHNIPFYVAAPVTTVDPKCFSGKEIPIEQRNPSEVLGAQGSFGSVVWAPKAAKVYNPSFDVTPAQLVSGWILDAGVFNEEQIKSFIKESL